MALAAAKHFSELEVRGDLDTLYDEMHPDAQHIIPREAVVGWYQEDFAPRGPEVAEAIKVRIVPWTWEVTGRPILRRPRWPTANALPMGRTMRGEVRLVKDYQGNWRWFFGRDRAFVEEQIARFAGPAVSDTGAQPQEACTSTADCSVAGGPSKCVRVLGNQGFMVIICLRDTGGACVVDDDCLRTMTCNDGVCGSLLAGELRTTTQDLALHAEPPDVTCRNPAISAYPEDEVPLVVIPAGSIVTLGLGGSVFGYIEVAYQGITGWVLEEGLSAPAASAGTCIGKANAASSIHRDAIMQVNGDGCRTTRCACGQLAATVSVPYWFKSFAGGSLMTRLILLLSVLVLLMSMVAGPGVGARARTRIWRASSLRETHFPPSLWLSTEGTRTLDEVANTFLDPAVAKQRLETWGWRENVFLELAPADARSAHLTLMQISLHRFETDTGAAAATGVLRGRTRGSSRASGRARGRRPETDSGSLKAPVEGGFESTVYTRDGHDRGPSHGPPVGHDDDGSCLARPRARPRPYAWNIADADLWLRSLRESPVRV